MRLDSTPISGHIRANNRAVEELLQVQEDGTFRDAGGELFRGWVWEGRDGTYWGQRMAAIGEAMQEGGEG